MMNNEEILLWVDLETTGLEARSCRILEVGLAVTDRELNVIEWWDSLVGPYPSATEGESWPAAVHAMHLRSGLFRELNTSNAPKINEVDRACAAWVDDVTGRAANVVLAGSSVHFDRGFMAAWMPELESRLHYRMADVSALNEFMKRWHPEAYAAIEEASPSRKLHRVKPDLEDSIARAATYRTVLRTA